MAGTALVLFLILGLFSSTSHAAVRFIRERYEATVEEDTTTSLRLSLIPLPECSRVTVFPTFSILNENVPFTLSVSGFFFVEVYFTRPPDAELGDVYYEVEIECSDGNSQATTIVAVNITSRNEYTPYARVTGSYSISFPETAEPGDVVSSLGQHNLIVDEDGGVDGVLSYETLNTNTQFFVNETGEVILRQKFDFDRNGSSTSALHIRACDRSTDPFLCPNVTVMISVSPANEFDPVFSKDTLTVVIPEGFLINHALATITCTDEDVGDGGYGGMEVSSMSPHLGEGGGKVELRTSAADGTEEVLLTAALDYDFSNQTEFEVVIRCFDLDSRGPGKVRSTYASVLIRLEPVNEFAPHFAAQWYNRSVLESVPVGSSLLSIGCSDLDRDEGRLAGIELYQPSQEDSAAFFLHPDTGILTLLQTLDYDNPDVRNHILTVRCYDDGGLDAVARISLSTLPVSDEPIAFLQPVFQFTVERLTEVNSRIGQVIVIDGDEGEVPVVVYSLEFNDMFEIDEEGYVILLVSLTRDKADFFNLSVTAIDTSGTDTNGPVRARVELSVTGLFSLVEVIYVTSAGFGLVAIVIIVVLVILCSSFCFKLYGNSRSGEDDVPVYVNNTAISSSLLRNKRNSSVQTTTAISSSLLSNKRNSSVQTTMDLPRKSTLSLQRHKRPQSGFKKRAKNRMKLDNSFCHANAGPKNSEEEALFGSDRDLNLFQQSDHKAEQQTSGGQTSDADNSTRNIFKPEDAGLLLEHLMMYEDEPLRWTSYEDNTEVSGPWSTIDRGGKEEEEEEEGTDSGKSAEWDIEEGEEREEGEEEEGVLTHI